MRILADTNIVAQAVRSWRDGGYDVVYAAERTMDPGDEALLAEAVRENRLFLTKNHDIGTLVYRELLDAGAFLRAGTGGVRESQA